MAPSVPPGVLHAAARALAGDDAPPPTVEAAVGGGCIHPAVRLRETSGRRAFLKWSTETGPAGFGVEARGLRALADRGGVPVPEVLGAAEGSEQAPGWLLLEWIEPSSPSGRTEAELGRGLAHLHRALPPHEAPGWHEDGWIGRLRQPNPEMAGWADFWASARLEPQWRRAREAGGLAARDDPSIERLLDGMPRALAGAEADGISLLHGDLWSGNVLVGPAGRSHLVDPAAYRGHREVDLAMMELFGGFGLETFDAYDEAAPLRAGYHEVRRGVYQLYPLLVHVNHFGGGYAARTLSTLRGVLAELGWG